jgi:hypothetical protein
VIDWDKPDPAGDMAAGYAGPPAGFLETVEAAKRSYEASRLFTAPNLYRGKVGRDVVDALRTRGRTGFTGADGRKVAYGADSLRSDYALNPTVAPRIWADVAAEQARDPSFLQGIGTPEQFDLAVLAARRRDYDEANEVLGRAEGFIGLTGELTGGLIGAMEDPIQLTALGATAGLPAGRLGLGIIEKLFGGRIALGTATKIAGEALGNAGVNVVATAPTLPVGIARAGEIGVETTGRDIAMELAGAAVAGGVLGATPPAIGAGVRSVRKMARELRNLDRPLTPAEADALPVLEQAAADLATSPFKPTPEGDAVHAERLTEAVEALESDRPMNPAVFETPAPAVREAAAPGFDPSPFLDAAEAYARDRKAGPLTTEALGEALGISRGQAQDVLSRLVSGTRGRGLFRVSYNPKTGVAKFSRPMLRKGPVDLITQLADMGGIRDNEGHSLLSRPGRDGRPREGAIGKVFVPGAGPLFRKGGMSIEQVGEWLHQNGWVQDSGVGGGIPTEAEVLDMIDNAVRTKMFHPEQAADAMAAERGKMQANDTEWQDRASWIRAELDNINGEIDPSGVTVLRLTDDDVAAIVPTLDEFDNIETAIWAHWDRQAEEALAEASAIEDDIPFDIADDPAAGGGSDGQADTRIAGDSGQSPDAAGNAPEGEPGSGGVGAASEAFNTAAAEQTLDAFDAPHGDGPKAQVEALQHDLKAEVDRETSVEPSESLVLPHKVHPETATPAARIEIGQTADGRWVASSSHYTDERGGGGFGTQPKWGTFATREEAILTRARAILASVEKGQAADAKRIAAWAQQQIDAAMAARPAEAAAVDPTPAAPAEVAALSDEAGPFPGYPMVEAANLSELAAGLKAQAPDAIVVVRVGDFYEAFGADAQAVASALDITLTSRNGEPMAGFPAHSLEPYLKDIAAAGHTIAVAEKVPGKVKAAQIDRFVGPAEAAPVASITEGAGPVGDTATGSRGLDAAQEAPAGGMTERQRAEMAARLQQSQMRRGGQQSADQISGGLFDAARDQLDAFAMPDGSMTSRADLLAEFDADDAALKTIKDCL